MNTKKLRIKSNTVTDEQGRQRFHGAFTGGFSAGYFNSVGSEEGFKPATFVSSRSQRAERVGQSAQDFMDEEDGLLNGTVTTKKDLDSFDKQNKVPLLNDESTDPSTAAIMKNFIIEPTNTVGKKLLGLLGWKPGQGIGSRKVVKNYFADPEIARHILSSSSLPAASLDEGMVTFASRYDETKQGSLPPSVVGVQGMGYDASKDSLLGLTGTKGDRAKDFTENNRYHVRDLFQPRSGARGPGDPAVVGSKRGRSTIYEDEDDDIAFDNDGQAMVDYSFHGQEEDEHDQDGYPHGYRSNATANDTLDSRKTQQRLQRCPSDGKPPLPGFVLATASAATTQPLYFPVPIPVPKDFVAKHVFPDKAKPVDNSSNSRTTTHLDPQVKLTQRSLALLGESADTSTKADSTGSLDNKSSDQAAPMSSSVFNLLRPADRERVLALAKKAREVATQPSSSVEEIPHPTVPPAVQPAESQGDEKPAAQNPSERPLLVPRTMLQASGAFAAVSASFQSRFTTASTSLSSAATNPPRVGDSTTPSTDNATVDLLANKGGLTTAEELRTRAAHQQQVHQQTPEGRTQSSDLRSKPKPVDAIPVKRTTILWQPNTLLCKRCNVKVPDLSTASALLASNTDSGASMGNDVVSQILAPLSNVAGSKNSASSSSNTSTINTNANGGRNEPKEVTISEEMKAVFEKADVYQQPVQPLAVFRSIFEDDSESEEDNEEDHKEDEEPVETDAPGIPSSTAASTATPDHAVDHTCSEPRGVIQGPKRPPSNSSSSAHPNDTDHPMSAEQSTLPTSVPAPVENVNDPIATSDATSTAPALLPTFVPRSQRTSTLLNTTTAGTSSSTASAVVGIGGLFRQTNKKGNNNSALRSVRNTRPSEDEDDDNDVDDGTREDSKKHKDRPISYDVPRPPSSIAAASIPSTLKTKRSLEESDEEDEADVVSLLRKRHQTQPTVLHKKMRLAGGISIPTSTNTTIHQAGTVNSAVQKKKLVVLSKYDDEDSDDVK